MAQRYRLVPAFQTEEPLPASSKEALAYQQNERRREILTDPYLNNEQKIKIYQAALQNMLNILDDKRQQRHVFPKTVDEEVEAETLMETEDEIESPLRLYGIGKLDERRANEVLEFLRQEEKKGNIVIDRNRRLLYDIQNPTTPVGKVDEVIKAIVSRKHKVSSEAGRRIRAMIDGINLPETLVKNTNILHADSEQGMPLLTSVQDDVRSVQNKLKFN